VNDGATYAPQEEMWGSYNGYPDINSKIQFSDDNQIKATKFSVPLAEIANGDGMNMLVERISEHKVHPLGS